MLCINIKSKHKNTQDKFIINIAKLDNICFIVSNLIIMNYYYTNILLIKLLGIVIKDLLKLFIEYKILNISYIHLNK